MRTAIKLSEIVRESWSGEPEVGYTTQLGSMLDLRDARARIAELERQVAEARELVHEMRQVEAARKWCEVKRVFDSTWPNFSENDFRALIAAEQALLAAFPEETK